MKKIFALSLMLLVSSAAGARLRNSKRSMRSAAVTAATTTPEKARIAEPEKITPTRADSFPEYPITLIYKPKHKRSINLQEVFVNAGLGYQQRQSSKAPMKNAITLNTNYCAPLFNKRLLFELGNNAALLFSPDKSWFSEALALPQSALRRIGTGISDQLTLGLHAVLLGGTKVTLTAGPQFGAQLTTLPSVNYGSSTYFISTPMLLCYGLKTNLFVGKYVYCFAQYTNTPTRDLVSNKSQSAPDASSVQRQTAVNFGALTVGAGYVFKTWW